MGGAAPGVQRAGAGGARLLDRLHLRRAALAEDAVHEAGRICRLDRRTREKKGMREWGMGNGEWGMGNGEWGMGNGEWGMGNGEWGMGNGEKMLFPFPTSHSLSSLYLHRKYRVSDISEGLRRPGSMIFTVLNLSSKASLICSAG